LSQFYKKTKPLIDFKEEVEKNLEEMFAEEWEQGSLYGWEEVLRMMKDQGVTKNELYCEACNKTFTNQAVL
jgi:hypothetical protein